MELWTKILALLILPPGGLILIAIVGFLLHIKWPLIGSVAISMAIALFIILGMPKTGQLMLASIERDIKPLTTDDLEDFVKQKHTAIVVLGGGRYADPPEFDNDTVNAATLMRLRYAAHLHRTTRLPVLVSGGSPFKEKISEAETMAQTLSSAFGVKARWIESRSGTTFENARYSKEILEQAGIKRVLLVTNAYHMRRAAWSFHRQGIIVTPAPTTYTTLGKGRRGVLGFLPSAHGLLLTKIALHERLGLMWYRLKFGGDRKKAKDPGENQSTAASPAG